MQHNPSTVYHVHDEKNHNNVNGDGDVDDVSILQQRGQHLLWHKEANEFIKHFPQRRQHKNQQQQLQQQQQQRHSTGVIYTHPSAIAMMTLSKRASDGITIGGGGELLSTRQRHQRDLFSGDLAAIHPPIIPPAPINFHHSPSPPSPPPHPPKRTHVGNVVHTFEAMAMQRRLAHQQQQPQQQQQQKYDNKEQQQRTFSKYLKNNTKRLTKLKWQTSSISKKQQQLSMPTKPKIKPQAHAFYITTTTTTAAAAESTNMPITMTRERKTFNECNKQIAQHYHHQMELDYRKNLFSTKPHVNILNFTTTTATTINNNNNNNNKIFTNTKPNRQKDRDREAEGEAVIVNFDEMLAEYSASDDDVDGIDDDDDDCYDDNHNNLDKEDEEQNYGAHVSVINISGNEAQDNVLSINLSTTNDKQMAAEQRIKFKIKQQQQHQQKQQQEQRLLPIMRKKAIAPAPPPTAKPTTKIRENKSLLNAHLCEKRILIPLTTATTKAIINKRADDDAVVAAAASATTFVDSALSKVTTSDTNDNFLRGSTLSQSFVRQFKWHKSKKPAPPPPIATDSSSSANHANNNNNNNNNDINKTIKTTTRLSLANPWHHVFRLKSKHAKSFDLLN